MRHAISILFLGIAFLAGTASAGQEFKVSSADMADNQPLKPAQVFNGFGCSGGDRSPQLQWSGAPAGTIRSASTSRSIGVPPKVRVLSRAPVTCRPRKPKPPRCLSK